MQERIERRAIEKKCKFFAVFFFFIKNIISFKKASNLLTNHMLVTHEQGFQ